MSCEASIYVPPEWVKQSAVWAGWPTLREEWGDAFERARTEIAGFVQALSKFTPVNLAVGSDEAHRSASEACSEYTTIHHLPLGDIWLRDTGPVFTLRSGAPSALCFGFDAWGGKYVMPGDTETGAAIAGVLGLPILRPTFTLEGGAVELDGAGNLITTRQCLLDGVRNPAWNEATAEAALNDTLGATNIIWLERGLMNDHTDGHVDNLTRFIGAGHAVCQTPSGSDDPNVNILQEVETALREAGLKVATLPSPGRIELDGAPVPASHMNFLITNGAVLLPSFEETYAPEAATALASLFPNRQIIPLPARNILAGGGTFHCMTREQPDFAALEIAP